MPWHAAALIDVDLSPDEGGHVHLINGVQFFFVEGPSSEQQQRVLMRVVVECEIGAGRGDFSVLVHLFECECGEIELPEVVIVLGIFISSEDVYVVLNGEHGVSPS